MLASQTMVTVRCMRPRFEGANICSWIGFKHLMSMVEDAVIEWFREYSPGPQRLLNDYGLGLEVLDSSVQLQCLVQVDDSIVAQVTPGLPCFFSVQLRVLRNGLEVVAANAKVRAGLIREYTDSKPAPEGLASLVLPSPFRDDAAERNAQHSANRLHWCWQARYFHCHYAGRVRHSAYISALEEVVDRFLADRGISISSMLREREWIPVVSRSRVTLLDEARTDEIVQTDFGVDEMLKRLGYNATMQCTVERNGVLVPVARATILHGYAATGGDRPGCLVEMDQDVITALRGEVQE